MWEYYDEELGDYVVTVGEIPWTVVCVEAFSDYSLVVEFSDGSCGRIDCRELILREPYRSLQDINRFMMARADHGTVDWGEDVDIAPEYLYEHAEKCSMRP